jgi:hypothetical protein
MRPWVSKMQLAAYTNDAGEFRRAYRVALEKSKKRGDKDPARSVYSSFQSRNPLRSIFRTMPDEAEMVRLLDALGDKRSDVENALRNYDFFLAQIKPTPTRRYSTASPRAHPWMSITRPTFGLDEIKRDVDQWKRQAVMTAMGL